MIIDRLWSGTILQEKSSLIRTTGQFLHDLTILGSDQVAMKLRLLAIRNAGVRWRRLIEWTTAMGQFAPPGGGQQAGPVHPKMPGRSRPFSRAQSIAIS